MKSEKKTLVLKRKIDHHKTAVKTPAPDSAGDPRIFAKSDGKKQLPHPAGRCTRQPGSQAGRRLGRRVGWLGWLVGWLAGISNNTRIISNNTRIITIIRVLLLIIRAFFVIFCGCFGRRPLQGSLKTVPPVVLPLVLPLVLP